MIFTERPEERDVRLKEAYIAFIRWSILTAAEKKAEKEPKTQRDFATKWSIHENTIVDWKARADFETLREDIFRKKLANEVPEVMGDLRKRIKKYGMGMDVELWLAYSKGWDRKKVLEINPPLDFGLGDIRAMIANLPKDKQKHFYQTLAKLIVEADEATERANSETSSANA